jgi:hypothetical protein
MRSKWLRSSVELLQRLVLQFLELLGQRLAAALAVVVVLFVELVEIFLGHVVVGLVVGDEAVHHLGDLHLAGADLVGHRSGSRRWWSGWR